MTLVVTGAAGFIGSQLAQALDQRGMELVLVDHPMVTSKVPNLEGLERHRFLGHRDFLAEFESDPGRFAGIFHMGACSSTVETNWSYLLENNVQYSQRLWEGCARAGTRLIYASSAATYGDGSDGFDDEADIAALRPLNLYGQSKQDFDLWVQGRVNAASPHPAQSVGLKFFNVWGPGEAHKGRMASMAFHTFRQIRERGFVRLFKSHRPDFEDGGQLRDFIYVGDVVRTILDLWDAPRISGLFNLGTGRAESFKNYTSAMFTALELEPRIEYIAMPEDLQGRYQYFTEATMSKIRAAGIPFEPTPLQDAMNQYAEFLCREERMTGRTERPAAIL